MRLSFCWKPLFLALQNLAFPKADEPLLLPKSKRNSSGWQNWAGSSTSTPSSVVRSAVYGPRQEDAVCGNWGVHASNMILEGGCPFCRRTVVTSLPLTQSYFLKTPRYLFGGCEALSRIAQQQWIWKQISSAQGARLEQRGAVTACAAVCLHLELSCKWFI